MHRVLTPGYCVRMVTAAAQARNPGGRLEIDLPDPDVPLMFLFRGLAAISSWHELSRPAHGTKGMGALALTAAMLLALGAHDAHGQPAVQRSGVTGSVYTANEHGNSLSRIDLATGRVETVPISISPHNVQISSDGLRLFAVGEAGAHASEHGHGSATHGGEAKGRLLVFDAKRLARAPVASIAVGDHPAHVVADRTAQRAFVTLAGADAVAVVELARKRVIATIATGRYPHGLRISPDGRQAYVANVNDGTVSVIDTVALAEIARIPVGRAPVQVGFTPDGRRVYVSLRDENRVAVIDTATRAVVARIDVGSNPIQVHATPDGRFVYVANQGTDAAPADTVSVIDVATGLVVDTIRSGMGAHGVAVSADGRHVFVTNIADSTVTMIETQGRSVVATFAVGKGPNGISFRSAR